MHNSENQIIPVVLSLSRVWLFATPMDCNPPGSSVHGIFLARILEWVANFLLQGIFLTQGSNPYNFSNASIYVLLREINLQQADSAALILKFHLG